jgi:AraC-like DNA-binding protein
MHAKATQLGISRSEDRQLHTADSLYADRESWGGRIGRGAQRHLASERRRPQAEVSAFPQLTHLTQDGNLLSRRIQAFVSVNLERGVTLKDLASFLGYSEKYSSEIFQLQMGVCFSHYVKDLRILKAKCMLMGEETSVTHIAELLGFSDSFSFSHFFKRAVGCSPTAFRKRRLIQMDDAGGPGVHVGNGSAAGRPSWNTDGGSSNRYHF